MVLLEQVIGAVRTLRFLHLDMSNDLIWASALNATVNTGNFLMFLGSERDFNLQPLKTCSPNTSTLSGSSTRLNDSQSLKATSPISFRCGGHTTSSKDLHILNKLSGNFERSLQAEKSMFLILQPQKADFPMEDKLSGRRISSREGHQLNADSPILSSFLQFDKSTEARASQLENAVSLISSIFSGKMIFVRFSHPAKANSPIIVNLLHDVISIRSSVLLS